MTMQAAQKEVLEEHFSAKDWYGRSDSGRRLIKEFRFEGAELKGWKLLKVKRSEQEGVASIRSMWSHGDNTDELLSVDVFVCASVKAAHDTLLEALGNMQSGAIERKTDKNVPGDVAFGLANTMIVFARANIVVLVRNAGPTIVPVNAIARDLNALIERRLAAE
jgi:hypothetical protein